MWLSYSDGEVEKFHPIFEAEANSAIDDLDLLDRYHWSHHPSDSVSGIPDFVLKDSRTGQWIVSIELKRTREAVWAPQFQMQAKGYAEANQTKYRNGWPAYFAISNLELLMLGALNGSQPPRDCFVEQGAIETADLGSISEQEHRQKIRASISELVQMVTSVRTPRFDQVWPAITEVWLSNSSSLSGVVPGLAEPSSQGWEAVRQFFVGDSAIAASRVFFLRCLAAEYLRGTLIRSNHPRVQNVPPLRPNGSAVSSTLRALQRIDFKAVFEAGSESDYEQIADQSLEQALRRYVRDLNDPARRVSDLTIRRNDSPALVDMLLWAATPRSVQDQVGKVQTDPELAAVLAAMAIHEPDVRVLDLGCGDGILLSAAYDRLLDLGGDPDDVPSQLTGIEVDPISLRLANIRLALKNPKVVVNTNQPHFLWSDAFTEKSTISDSDVILMNPPFKRYEAQDEVIVPPEMRKHFADRIREDANDCISDSGQSNLYSFFVELVATSAKDGAIVGLILDNRWFQNRYATQLRQLILDQFEVIAIVDYPHSAFFSDWMVTTSLLIARKSSRPASNHEAQFVRSRIDPRSTDLGELSSAATRQKDWPIDWTARSVLQSALSAKEGWKRHFATPLKHDIRSWGFPTLNQLFEFSRRGSLNKEGGGLDVLEFPFAKRQYGPRRLHSDTGGRFSTERDTELSEQQNDELRTLADAIPDSYRGLAIKNSDRLSGYILSDEDTQRDQTLEPPVLRNASNLFANGRRSPWTRIHELALVEMSEQAEVDSYVDKIYDYVNLNEAIPSDQDRWLALREPYAGELVIPRKLRGGHRVHVNLRAIQPGARQVRLSSNFISFSNLSALEVESGLDREVGTQLVASFLLSVFGQLQFELEGYNREGMLAIEKAHLARVSVFDPRQLSADKREAILAAFESLPYPMPPYPCASVPERVIHDKLWAAEIGRDHNVDPDELLSEWQDLLDEFIAAREP